MHPAMELGNHQLGDPAEEKLVRDVRDYGCHVGVGESCGPGRGRESTWR